MRASQEMRFFRALCRSALCAGALLACGPVLAQPQKDPGEIRGLSLGQLASEMSVDGFGEFACGGNGGPARQPIEDWSEYRKCRPEPGGLHEVAVRFDDQEEFVGKAIDDPMYTRRRGIRFCCRFCSMQTASHAASGLSAIHAATGRNGAWRTCCGWR